jgi:hypothetical protein
MERAMTNEYEWIDKRDKCHRDFGMNDFALGWAIFSIALLYLIV